MSSSVRSKSIGKVSELTVVTPIRPGMVPGEYRTYRLRLEHALRGLQSRIEAGIPTPPSLIPTIHFARWFVLARDGGPGDLVFTSNFDGDPRQYLRDFSLEIPDNIDQIWGNCVGYPAAGCRDFDAFWGYARAHQVEALAFVPSYPHVTTRDIQLAFPTPT